MDDGQTRFSAQSLWIEDMAQKKGSTYFEERLRRRVSPRDQLNQIKYVPRALNFVWQAARGWTLISTIILIIRGVLPGITVYLTKEMINALVEVIDNSGDRDVLMAALPVIIIMAATILIRELLGDVQSYVRAVLADRTQDYMYGLIHEKTITLDMEFYDSSSYFDTLQRATVEAVSRPLSLLSNINNLLESMITLLAMIGVLFTLSWWTPFLLIIGTIPTLFAAIKTTRVKQEWRLERTTERRRLNYYKRLLSDDLAMPELKIFNLDSHFKQSYSKLRTLLREESLGLFRKGLLRKSAGSLFGLAILAMMLGWMAWSAFTGLLDLGEIVMFWQATNQGRSLMRSFLLGFDVLYTDLLFLEDLFAFLELEPQVVDPVDPEFVKPGLNQGIELKDVFFHYPGSETNALSNFSLSIPKGNIVAIVGENGAGKSTLIKLLCRFYDPQQGLITWDGVDLRKMTQADLRRRITVLFQRPVTYYETAADNIRFGDLSNQPTQSQIVEAVRAGGAQDIIHKLPDGYNTVLGKRFGTAELSIGEWQRIALARAFVRKSDLIILDEPTSAMDSWAEIAWMRNFRNLADQRSALIITHRFTTAMQADIIHVMVKGRIVESGTHAELVAMNGLYAESWRQQMQEAGHQTG